jgi:hypothetical protein
MAKLREDRPSTEACMTEIADQVRQLISDHFRARQIDPSQVVPEAHLVEGCGRQ